MARTKKAAAARFVEKINYGEEHECWTWKAATDREGYGRFNPTRNRGELAHRYAYRLFKGTIEAGQVIRHLCNNPSCVNPNHLAAGTQKENMQDRDEAGNTPRGERNGMAKLTEEQVIEVFLDRSRTCHELAREHNVSVATISAIRCGSRWQEVTNSLVAAIETVASEMGLQEAA